MLQVVDGFQQREADHGLGEQERQDARTVRGQNRQKLSPSRELAGSSGVATRRWCPRLCSTKKWP
ncbi:hypothetical protein Aau02nite_88730 [Amorphoplanes auranticolor]|uniref:Uncharacterized protein n=1 Tax=Actinoplanes auranticolor TaxID=47988 RepID=A0A919SYH8_9ACTN|nr:hypothetical protein Aau02nite_88730 [Actinoplanes auranticolor]